jgi:hypothetical protein
LGEHQLCTLGVIGSSPFTSTSLFDIRSVEERGEGRERPSRSSTDSERLAQRGSVICSLKSEYRECNFKSALGIISLKGEKLWPSY